MNVVRQDNVMLVLIRDEDDKGYSVGWSPHWLEKCKSDPHFVAATMQAVGQAMMIFSAEMINKDAPPITPGSTKVN
jgi:hypothetical protein